VRCRGTLFPALAAAPPTTIANRGLRPTLTTAAAAPLRGAGAEFFVSFCPICFVVVI